ncbi:hypothetical protein BST81_02335 [Leptolyngbya sp. 'hensonii']|uniref:serine protease n=1 Tax=Leptolyngbya sp. 'hensonii' TaxID=1922337 RepID=UPI00094F77A0|nr:serine protease [Leptolyngbya sp. 'hensonii']OLP20095.1 hypothetical protein BST81_02335 [Leptolyngbya sp. 'hensonii']
MSQLEDLLQQCTVRLTLPGRLGWGTGFFVAPGWILTCAHVVQEARDESVQVRWQKQENWAQTTVERLLADPLDLALLRVIGSTEANQPCVYFDEEIRSRDPLYLFGYPDQDFPNGCPVTFNCEGLTGDESALIKFALGQVRPGMSGAPLLNQRTGKVCGMVKFTRDRSFDLGGGAIPTQMILEQLPELRSLQQTFHGHDLRWVNLITSPGPDFQPYREAVIYHYSQQRHLYTPTDALLSLEARSVKRQAQDNGREQPTQETVEQFPVLEGLRKYALGNHREHVLLAGRPGSGKSTTLRQLAVSLAEEGQVPVLVQLKGDLPVLEAIASELEKGDLYDLELKEIKRLLRQQQFVLLLDGVNEIPNESLRRSLIQFRQDNLTVPMIFTTRDFLGGDLGIGKRLEMKPLSEEQMREFISKYLPEQMREFISKYLPEQGDLLLDQLLNRLRELAETPLLLKLMCDVVGLEINHIPQNQGELFQWFDRDYKRIKKEIEYVSVSENFWEFKSEILRYLAFSMIQGEVQSTALQKQLEPWLTIPNSRAAGILETWLHQRGTVDAPTKAKLWLKDLCNHDLLQNAAKPEEIEFHHQLFQEYYAAEYLLDRLPSLTDEQLKWDYLNYLKWTEPIALMLALVNSEVQALRVVQLALDVDLVLGAKLAGAVKPMFQEQTVKYVEKLAVPAWLKSQLLRESRSHYAVSALLELLDHADADVFMTVAMIIGEFIPDSIIVEFFSKVLDECDIHGSMSEALNNALVDDFTGDFTDFWTLFETIEQFDPKLLLRIATLVVNQFEMSQDSFLELIIPHIFRLIKNNAIDVTSVKIVEKMMSQISLNAVHSGRVELIESLGKQMEEKVLNTIDLGTFHMLAKLLESVNPDQDWGLENLATKFISETSASAALPKLFEEPGSLMSYSTIDTRVSIGSSNSIDEWIKLLSSVQIAVRWDAAQVLVKIAEKHPNKIASYLSYFLTLIPTLSGKQALKVITATQVNCKFYNYEIFQAHLAAQRTERQTHPNGDSNAITIKTLESLTIMSDKAPIFNQQHATIGVNYAAEGSTIEFTQQTSSSEQTFEILLTDYQQFIEQLQQKYPTLADPTTVPQIIEVEAKLIKAQDHQRWQNFINLKRLWNGGKKAGIKVGEHFAENNVWAKGAIAFLEGVSEDGK